jgi:hypothetical protein
VKQKKKRRKKLLIPPPPPGGSSPNLFAIPTSTTKNTPSYNLMQKKKISIY